MSYAGDYPGSYGAGYAPGAGAGPGQGMASATIESPPVTGPTGMTQQDHMREFLGGSEEVDEYHPRTLYVGNLDASISEEFLTQLFGQIGTITKCKIIHEVASDPYAFIEFQDHLHAVQALTAMNKRILMAKEMRVNWATSPGTQQRVDTSKHYHVFIGDLSPEIDNRTLKEAFAPFGQISDVKVIRDLQTLKSKGYGFVSFVNKEEAERAIEHMNGQWLGRRAIRTNWATRKPGMPGPSYGVRDRNMTMDDIMSQSHPNNRTVYVGGIGGNTTDDDLRQVFMKYGTIVDIRVFRQQGYAFIRYDNHEAAGQAIYNANNTDINGSTVRCSWGKEGGYATQAGQNSNYGYGYGYGGGGAPNFPEQPNSSQNYNYWNQYYQYYGNPSGYQQQQQQQPQWQGYWQQGGGQ